jgi:hypothetical protein
MHVSYHTCLGLLAVMAFAGCQPMAPAGNSPAGQAALGVEDFKFSSPDMENRFRNFDTAARELCDASFSHQGYEQGGNFVSARWAKGADLKHPIQLTAPLAELRDVHRVHVDTIVVPFPNAVSAALAVEHVSADPDQWSVALSYREAQRNGVTGPNWHIRFYRWDAARYRPKSAFRPEEQARDRVLLPTYGYSVADSNVSVRSELPMLEDFLRHVRSSESLRDAYLADLAALEAKAIALIESHAAVKSVSEAYRGDGLPPNRHSEPLTAAEEAAELQKAKDYFARQSDLMRTQHKEMYAALRAAFPLEKCWPELNEGE